MNQRYGEFKFENRDSKFKDLDQRIVRWIAQAAVDVELFTIPLYMTSMYSLAGMHQITGAGNDFYKDRWWPGMAPAPAPRPLKQRLSAASDGRPGEDNQKGFNCLFSVFIQEMLHLQLAANISTAIGGTPSFTSSALQNERHGWICYGDQLTVIPRIVDLRDVKGMEDVYVKLGPLDDNQIRLFLAIEEPTEQAENKIKHPEKYFPVVPFSNDMGFDPDKANIMFGSIGYMYQCLKNYLNIRYTDTTTLWEHVFNPNGQQNDLFNNFSFPGHPMREFPSFETTIALTYPDVARRQAFDMMDAITDQGEGSLLKQRKLRLGLPGDVEMKYRANRTALKSNYPSYDDQGKQVEESADAMARIEYEEKDHYKRFQELQELMKRRNAIWTWDQTAIAGEWDPDDLGYDSDRYDIPKIDEVAQALNELYLQNREDNKATIAQAICGAIKGVTTVLDQYWNPVKSGKTVAFPFPSMAGTGDRMAIYWAIFNAAPDLAVGVPSFDSLTPIRDVHACQSLRSYSASHVKDFTGTNTCAAVSTFHTCKGSNLCRAIGGCGFAHLVVGGGNCSAAAMRSVGRRSEVPPPTPQSPAPEKDGDSPPPPTDYTAPSNNFCGGFGGCAVPISASQLYPIGGKMAVYQLAFSTSCKDVYLGQNNDLTFNPGDRVDQTAYKALKVWAESVGITNMPDKMPPPNALRIALPPST